MVLAPAPLFRDPVEDGAADPTVIWNPHEGAWWMVYTNRRTTAPFEDGIGWLFGAALGVASSVDGVRWDYRGTLTGLDVEWGHNTFWAPEIVADDDGTFHMFVSYIRGIPAHGSAPDMLIRHYTSPDLLTWTHLGVVPLGSSRVIDACVHRLPGGGWRMWFKEEDGGGRTVVADSPDLTAWTVRGLLLETPGGHEGPNVFALGGWYWLLVDTWRGQAAYRSTDLETWEPAGEVLTGTIGQRFARTDDVGPGLHGDVVSDGERAWIFYFTHPDRTERAHPTPVSRRSSIQVAELTVVDGRLHCDRDADVDLDLPVPARPAAADPG